MDIKDYNKVNVKDFVNKVQNDNLTPKEETALNDLKEQYGSQIEDLISKFQNMSEAELITEIFKIINEKKRNGTFNPSEIDKLAEMIKPLLNEEQKQKMEELINLIK